MKKNNETVVSNNETIVSNENVVSTENVATVDFAKLNKTKQQMLINEIKRQKGLLKKGRPIDLNSVKQRREAELSVKREAGLLKQGRPAYSEAEKVLAEQRRKEKKEQEEKVYAELAKQMIESGVDIEQLLS